MIGFGTIFNVATILVGTLLGTLLGSKLSEKTNRTVTDSLGLITIVLGGLNLMSLFDKDYVAAVTGPGTFFIVIFAVLFGGAVALLPIFARDLLHIGPWGLGILRSAPAIGAATVPSTAAAPDMRTVISFVARSM